VLVGGVAYYFGTMKGNMMPATTQVLTQTTPTPKPTVDPTANWKIYANTKYNYSFKYPENWNLRSFAGSQQTNETADSFAIEGPYQNIQTQEGGPGYSITVSVVATKPSDVSTSEKLVSSESIGNKYLEFDMISSQPDKTISDTKTFDQILSTFQFTGQGQTTDLNTTKSACIALEGSSKAWDDTYKECDEGGATKVQLQTFCTSYGGKFEDNVDVCRHATGPCGPAATYTCSFSTTQ
jgi:hypothetical protein